MIGELLAFAGVMALGQFSPGPDMLLLTRTSLAQGRTAGWWTTAGITTGLCVHAALAIFFTRWLVGQGGWIAAALRWVAAAYLAWLVRRAKPHSRLRGTVIALSVFSISQLAVGVGTVWFQLPLLLLTLHNCLAAGLLLSSVNLLHRLAPPAVSPSPE